MDDMEESNETTVELFPRLPQSSSAFPIKLPNFWQSNPSGWFYSIEAQFALRNITDDTTRYHYVLASLGNDTSAAIEGLLDNPPRSNLYAALKTELLKVYGLTEKQKKRQLLSLAGLGDRKPTELLRHMKSLHKTHPKDILFMALFVQQLPASVRSILAAQDFDDINQLAEAADEVIIEQETATVSIVGKQQHETAQKDRNMCYYHKRWGAKAFKCQGNCSWSGNELASH